MTTYSNTFEGLASGVAVTAANSGGTSGNAFNSAFGVALVTSSTHHHNGAIGALLTNPTSSGGYVTWNAAGDGTKLASRLYFKIVTAPSATISLAYSGSSFNVGGNIGVVAVLNSNLTTNFQDYQGNNMGGTSPALSLSTWYRFEYSLNITAKTGMAAVYVGDSTTALYSFGTTTLISGVSGFSIISSNFGSIYPATTSVAFDDVSSADQITYIGPAAATRNIASISSDFSAMPTFFDANYGSVSVSGGQLNVESGTTATGSSYSAVATSAYYDLTNSQVFVQIAQQPGTVGSREFFFELTAVNGDQIQMFDSGGSFQGRLRQSGVSTSVNLGAYSASAHAWWRIRHYAGVVYWDVSSDGAAWTSLGNLTPTMAVSALKLDITNGHYATETSPPAAVVDNLNYVSISATLAGVIGNASATALSGSVSSTRSASLAGQLSTASASALNGAVAAAKTVSLTSSPATASASALNGSSTVTSTVTATSSPAAAAASAANGSVSTTSSVSASGYAATVLASALNGTVLAVKNTSSAGTASTASAAALSGAVSVTSSVNATTAVATASAFSPNGSVVTGYGVALAGSQGTATASSLNGSVSAIKSVSVAGVLATSSASALAGSVAAGYGASLAGQLASALASALTGTSTAIKNPTLAGFVAAATAYAPAGTADETSNVAVVGQLGSVSAYALAGTASHGSVIAGPAATVSAIGVSGNTGGSSSTAGQVGHAAALANAGSVAAIKNVAAAGTVAVAQVMAPNGSVTTGRSVASAGATATASASALAGSTSLSKSSTLTGPVAASAVSGLSGTVLATTSVNFFALAATASAASLPGSVSTSVLVTGDTAVVTALGKPGKIVMTIRPVSQRVATVISTSKTRVSVPQTSTNADVSGASVRVPFQSGAEES